MDGWTNSRPGRIRTLERSNVSTEREPSKQDRDGDHEDTRHREEGVTTPLDERRGHGADSRRREHNQHESRRAGSRDRVPRRGNRHNDQRYQYGQPKEIGERARDRRTNDKDGEKDGREGGEPL